MAIPRRLLVVAASAIATGIVLYARSRMNHKTQDKQQHGDKKQQKSAVDEANEHKEAMEAARRHTEDKASSVADDEGRPAASTADRDSSDGDAGSLARRELSLFLAGDAWHDEIGWRSLWEREGVQDSAHWLRADGRDVLSAERKKLAEHPALLAGCRRRWIVVCRYGGIDVGDAAAIWNSADA